MGALTTARNFTQWEDQKLIQTIKETVCKGATDSQFRMFVEVCKATGLNPWLREIWFVPAVGVMAGRDGYLRVANEHPMFDGMSTTVERDEKGVPIKATCSVWRKDRAHPITCEAYYSEYKKTSPIWSSYPSAMISKVAEVLALKRSFSINGVVTEEEIGEQKAEGKAAQIAVAKARIEELKQIQTGSTISAHELAEVEPDPVKWPEESKSTWATPATEEDHKPEPKPARKRGGVSFKQLEFFKDMKTEMRKVSGLATDEHYYDVLRGFGVQHADEIKDDAEAKRIYKVLGSRYVELKTAHPVELENLLTECQERLGIPKFMAILGAHGCEKVGDVLNMASAPLEALLKELKQAVDDQKGTK